MICIPRGRLCLHFNGNAWREATDISDTERGIINSEFVQRSTACYELLLVIAITPLYSLAPTENWAPF